MIYFNINRIQRTYSRSFNLRRKASSYSTSKTNYVSSFSFSGLRTLQQFNVKIYKSNRNESFPGKY